MPPPALASRGSSRLPSAQLYRAGQRAEEGVRMCSIIKTNVETDLESIESVDHSRMEDGKYVRVF